MQYYFKARSRFAMTALYFVCGARRVRCCVLSQRQITSILKSYGYVDGKLPGTSSWNKELLFALYWNMRETIWHNYPIELY